MPWGAKKKFPQVSTDLCAAISLTHICVQNLENPAANIPTTISAENFVEPKSNEVRWSIHLFDVHVNS